MITKSRFIVYEQSNPDEKHSRVNDVFGIFYSYKRAEKLCNKLQAEHPEYHYGIRELLNGNTWIKSQ